MDLMRIARRRVVGWRSAPGSGVPSAALSPTSSGSFASTGRAPFAPRGSSPATPPPPRTSRRRRFSPPCATSTASTAAGRSAPWLHRIVVNRAIDWTRARRLRAEVELGDYLAAPPAPSPRRRVRPHRRAPAEHRAVVVLRYVLEYTPGEIAELLDLPRGTVNSRLRRGLDRMKDVTTPRTKLGGRARARSRSARRTPRRAQQRDSALAATAPAVAAVRSRRSSRPRVALSSSPCATPLASSTPTRRSSRCRRRGGCSSSPPRRRHLARRGERLHAQARPVRRTPSGRRTGSTCRDRRERARRARPRRGRPLDARATRPVVAARGRDPHRHADRLPRRGQSAHRRRRRPRRPSARRYAGDVPPAWDPARLYTITYISAARSSCARRRAARVARGDQGDPVGSRAGRRTGATSPWSRRSRSS